MKHSKKCEMRRSAVCFASVRLPAWTMALVLLAALCLTGCGAQQAALAASTAPGGNAAQSAAPPEAPAQAGAIVGTLRMLAGGYRHDFAYVRAVNTGNASYELLPLPQGEGLPYLLLKTDYATAQQTALCQKQGCAHADESCNAYFRGSPRIRLDVIGDMLYVFFAGHTVLSNDGTPMEAEITQYSYVDAVSLDGATRRRVVQFPGELDVRFQLCDDNTLYGYYEAIQAQNGGSYDVRESDGIRLDLASGEYTKFSMSNNGAYRGESFVGVYNNLPVMSSQNSEQDLNGLAQEPYSDAYLVALQNSTWQYSTLDPYTGQQETLASYPRMEASLTPLFVEQRMYYHGQFVTPQGYREYDESVRMFDIPTQQETVLVQTMPDGMNMDAPVTTDGTPGGTLVSCWGSSGIGGTEGYLELTTGEVLRAALKTDAGSFATLLAPTDDDRWLIAIGTVGEEQPGTQLRYALITWEDFFAGNANYTEIPSYMVAE